MKAWLRRWIGFRFAFQQASLPGNSRSRNAHGRDNTE
jgi:hypothetical protein